MAAERLATQVSHATTSNSSTHSFVGRLTLYFVLIGVLASGLIYLMMIFMLQWVEDEVSLNNLRDSAPYVIKQFRNGTPEPLVLPPNITAFHSTDFIPSNYGELQNYPLGFNGEINDDSDELFLYRSEFVLNGRMTQLFITMPAENIELSKEQWNGISGFIIVFTFGLILLFSFAIFKLFRRLIAPINQLSMQLGQASPPTEFTVSQSATKEFGILTDSLNHYRQQIETLIKQEQAFARYASHELRTPLSIVLGSAKLLAQKPDADFQLRQRERITRAAQDMQNTVEALLNIVKQEKSANANPPRQLTELELAQTLETTINQAKQQDIEVIMNWHGTPTVQPNSAVVKMLLTNLINNAINARSENLPAEEVSWIKVSIFDDRIVIEDNGQGLSEVEKGHQGTELAGHGLGLVIIDTLCQRYNWLFNLEENQPKGCIATLSLPKINN
ncbi:HAMP domain-containing sensor histidine kinase [uncultured Shewanella sp.]|uniref:sensor histidine kinase n=1 Tax=uncultured Shewanella sp. TaxID=173975 RepID=UPI00262E78D7|nr:HAMP domain-containing sensor histidine kinase [uncultured Shewanella sp.]